MALNPDVILLSGDGGPGRLRDVLLADPALQEIRAVRSGRVHVIPGPSIDTLSHHIVKGVEAIARALHPEIFATAGST